MRNIGYILLTLCLLSCGKNSDTLKYSSIQDFQSEVDEWMVLGKTLIAAKNISKTKGFECVDTYCFKDIPGLVCNQRLRVSFIVNNDELVTEYKIWTIDGKFPTQCL